MPDTMPKIPQPTAMDQMPPPEIPAFLKPLPPGLLRLIEVAPSGADELAVIYKQTYSFSHGKPARPAEKQFPLAEQAVLHDPLAPDAKPSYKELPELIGFKTGTDVVIQASAMPGRAVPAMVVEARVGRSHNHKVQVTGRRFCDYVNSQLVFTPAEPFEEMPLRYENAYGGEDKPFNESVLKAFHEKTPPETARKVKPSFEGVFSAGHPLMYPRSRFGKGYVIEDRRELIQGRELPNLEWPNDRLIPGRLITGCPAEWNKQPLPVGFDFLDPFAFPRTAMMGMPPAGMKSGEAVPEVARKLIPAAFCRGNIFTCPKPDLPQLVHPLASRSASLGMWLPFLKGDETIVLAGMDPGQPEFSVQLPGWRPIFNIKGLQPTLTEVAAEPYLVRVMMKERLISIVWVGRTLVSQPLGPEALFNLLPDVQVKMVEI